MDKSLSMAIIDAARNIEGLVKIGLMDTAHFRWNLVYPAEQIQVNEVIGIVIEEHNELHRKE